MILIWVVAWWWRYGGALLAVAAAASPPFCYQFGIEYAARPLRWRMSLAHSHYESASC
jgi:hypothetical protein